MQKLLKKNLVGLACGALVAAVLSVGPVSPFQITSEANCGGHGGHHRNRTSYTTESYYYCGGHQAHVHNNGVCPYAYDTSVGTQNSSSAETLGWHHDERGWRYRNTESSCYSDCAVNIDGVDCYFDSEGYLKGNQ